MVNFLVSSFRSTMTGKGIGAMWQGRRNAYNFTPPPFLENLSTDGKLNLQKLFLKIRALIEPM